MSKHDELIERLRASAAAMPFDAAVAVQYQAAADALEAQAREIEELRKDAERWKWATEQAEFYSMVVDGTGLLCATLPEAEAAIDAAKGAPHG